MNNVIADQYESPDSSGLPPPTEQCVHLEMQSLENLKPNALCTTHLPFDAKRFNSRAKYIVVMRNPRDVCVSYYHHYTFMIKGAHGTLR